MTALDFQASDAIPADDSQPLLTYQRAALAASSRHALLVVEKSRRTGLTWAFAFDAALTAGASAGAHGMDFFYIGYNLEMAREFIDYVGQFATILDIVADAAEEFLFDDGSEKGIQAFRITFAGGFHVVALPSTPRSLRGKQGKVLIDEAAFHDDLAELLKAALALLMWGGRVVVISTHNGADNAFNELISEIRAGRRTGHVLRIDLRQALEQGLYRRICFKTGQVWSAESEAAWEAALRATYGAAAEEELDCVPSQGSGAFLSLSLIEAAHDASIPVVRWAGSDAFTLVADHLREADIRDWCEREIRPHLERCDVSAPSFIGVDFARTADLSVFWAMQALQSTRRATPLVLELRNMPFEQQRQVLFYLADRLPRFAGAALDKGGNGAYLAEVALQRYGPRVAGIAFSADWYREQMPPFKAAFEDGAITIPADRDIDMDLRAIKLVKGVARVPDQRTTGADKGQRHGDAAIAAALAFFSSRQEPPAYDYERAPRPSENDRPRLRMRADDHDAEEPRWLAGAY